MKVVVNKQSILDNIKKAESLTSVPISLMFKDFYSYVYDYLGEINNEIFALNIKNSVCYSLCKASSLNKAALVTSVTDAIRYENELGIKEFYIPINAEDNREGLCISEVNKLAMQINQVTKASVYGLITSGCLNEKHPSEGRLFSIWKNLRDNIKSISLGGSFWLGRTLPYFIKDVRIGEYMLFGTIPYSNDKAKIGYNGLEIYAKILEVYPDRKQLIVDCGYSMADMDRCKCKDGRLSYVDCSSEYTIMEYSKDSYFSIGDTIVFLPNYKSLVKLRYADREVR